jgi:hypothetical protein
MISLLWIACAACGGAGLGLYWGFRMGSDSMMRAAAFDCFQRLAALGVDPRVWLLAGEKPQKPTVLQ